MEYERFLGPDTFAVYLFHGVIPEVRHAVRNYTRKHLPVADFIHIVERLRQNGTAVSMSQVAEATAAGTALPANAFAVTFDDGFLNNYQVAAPVLEERGIPATFYVTTDFVGANKCSWTDLIEYAVETVESFRIDLAELGMGTRTVSTVDEKRQFLDDIRRAVKYDRALDPYAVAEDVSKRLGVREWKPDPDLDEKMTWDDVRRLGSSPFFTIGGHGVTHRILEFLDQTDLEGEISGSIRILQKELSGDVTHYSYPEGLSHCYSPRVIAALRREGVICAPSAEPGTNRLGDDLFHLKRITVV